MLGASQDNLAGETDRQRPEVITADSLPELLVAIDMLAPKYEMILVQEGYKGHNIVQYLGRFWGLPLTLGHVNLADAADRQRPGGIVADSLPDLLAAVDRVASQNEIVLVQEGYKAHNIVQYLGRFWGLPLALGHVNLADDSHRQRPGVIVEDSLPELLAAIDSVGAKFEIAPTPVKPSCRDKERAGGWWETFKIAFKIQ